VHQEASCTLQVTAAGEAGARIRDAKPNIEGQNSGRRRGNRRRFELASRAYLWGLLGVSGSALHPPVGSRGPAADLFSPCSRCSTTLAASSAPTCVGPACVEVPMAAVSFKRVPGGFLVAVPTGAGPAMMVPTPRPFSQVSPIGACMLLTRKSVRHANPPRNRG
jgi:hypothetical protein